MLGIVCTNVSAFQKLPNAHFLGQVEHDALPAYLLHADVFLLPYLYSSMLHYGNPMKLFECLAVGKPTVGFGLPIFSEYRHMLSVAASRDEYELLVADAVREGHDSEKIEQRRRHARANTWAVRFAEMNAAIQSRISSGGKPS